MLLFKNGAGTIGYQYGKKERDWTLTSINTPRSVQVDYTSKSEGQNYAFTM